MFGKRWGARDQARRDQEWRSLVRAITDPSSAVTDRDEDRLRAYLRGEAEGDPGASGDNLQMHPRERLSRSEDVPAPLGDEREQSLRGGDAGSN